MLTVVVEGNEYFDKEKNEFVYPDAFELELEHSLVSLSKWEQIHEKPLLGPNPKTEEETLSYIECMILDPKFPPGVISKLSPKNLEEIQAYMDAKMTATWFNEVKEAPSREVITSELIYFWMISFNIPLECQYWHLNRLMTLLKVFNLKNSKPKKMSSAEIAKRNREINERRKAQYGTTG